MFNLCICIIAGYGKSLVLSDSMAKYVNMGDHDVKAFRGDTVRRLTDRIRFGEVEVSGYSRILIHVGSNDLSNMVSSGHVKRLTVFHMMDRYVALRNSIRRRNSQAVLLISAVLPRVNRFTLFKPYIIGLNFSLEKWCAKTRGACIFIPSYDSFMVRGEPNAALISDKDGLHLDGGGVDVLEGLFQQALSTGYLGVRVRTARTYLLRTLEY